MKIRRFYCNHCGKELDPVDDYIDYDIDFDELSYAVDLCTECKDALVEKIDTIVTRYSRGEE